MGLLTPQEPGGTRTSALRYATAQQQIDTARFWFLSNYEPFINDGRWFGFDRQGSGFGQAPFAPNRYPPGTLLQEEFAETIPEDALTVLATELESQAGLWMLVPDPSQTMLAIMEGPPANPVATVNAALARVEADAAKAEMIGLGHNQGPPLLGAGLREEIIQAVRLARDGVAAKEAGVPAAEEGRGYLRKTMAVLGAAVLAGIGKHAGEDIYSAALPAAIRLFHSLNEAVMALGHWLAMHPPSPLM